MHMVQNENSTQQHNMM